MKMLIIATAAIFGLGIAVPAHAAKEIDCMVMWEKADLNKNGILKGDDATAYLDAIKKSGKTYEVNTPPPERRWLQITAQSRIGPPSADFRSR
jgi:hypothetical protein